MKKVLSLLLTFLMVFSIVGGSVSVYAESTENGAISVEKKTANQGDEVEVQIAMDKNPGIVSMTLTVTYDSDNLTLTDVYDGKPVKDEDGKIVKNDKGEAVTESTLPGQAHSNKLASPYTLCWVNDASYTNYTDTGVLATLTFKVNESAPYKEYPITVTYDPDNPDIYNVDIDLVDCDITNGSITVVEKEKEDATTKGTLVLDGEAIPETLTYDGKEHTFTVTGAAEGSTVTFKDDVDSFKDAGTYNIEATVSHKDYKDYTLTANVVVGKKDVTISGIKAEDKEYDGTTDVKVDTSNVEFEGKIDGDDLGATFLEFKLSSADVGSYTLDFNGTTLSGTSAKNYTLKEIKEVTVNVTQKPIHIVINNATKVAGIDSYALTWKLADDEAEGNISLINDGELAVNITNDEAGKTYNITLGTLNVKDTKNYKLVVDKEGTLTIVEKAPKKVTVTGTMKAAYYEGEPFDATGLTVTATYDVGGTDITESVELGSCSFTSDLFTDDMKMKEVGRTGATGTVKLSYLGVEATKEDDSDWSETVTVKDNPIASITVNADGAQKVYKVGDTSVSKEGLVVTATYKNEEDNTAPKNSRELNADEYGLYCDLAATGDYIGVTVELDEDHDIRGSYIITVINRKLIGLKIVDTNPSALSLIEGQTFNLEGSGVKVYALFETYTDAAEREKDITNQFYKTVENITRDEKDSVEIPLEYKYTYGDYYESASCKLIVTFAEKSVSGIEVLNKDSDSIKTKYYEGDTFDPTGAKIKLYYDNGSDETITENYGEHGISFSPAPLTAETTKVTVSVGKFSDTIDVTVIPVVLDHITVALKDADKTYVDGETLSKDDFIVTAVYNNKSSHTVTDYTTDVETFTLTDKTVAEDVTVTVSYKDVESVPCTVKVIPCVATIGEDRYGDLQDAIDAADEGDTIELPLAGEYDVDVDKELTFENTSGEDITITINDEEVTIADGETYEVEIEEEEEEKPETDTTYFAFYLQMLQWRNRTFLVSYKQTEGGTISGANSVRFSQSVTFTVTPNEGYEIADVTVNGKSVGAVETYTIKNIKANTTVSASFNKIETETVEVEIVPETTVWVNPFTDVAETDAFYAAVQYVYENGLFKGMSSTEFAPATTMNRAMFVTVLGRLTGVNVDDYTTVTFSDCEAGSWYAPYVEWAAKAGIVKGMSATEFAPDAEITVEQAVTILYRYMTTMGYDLSGAVDLTAYADGADVADWAAEAMQWAVANNIYVADTLAPQTAAARSLVATMLYNLSNLLVK